MQKRIWAQIRKDALEQEPMAITRLGIEPEQELFVKETIRMRRKREKKLRGKTKQERNKNRNQNQQSRKGTKQQ